MSRKEVRIAVVGSAGVGKSSIITALISETFQEKVAPIVPPLTIPPEVTPEKVTTHIIDTSSRPSDYASVEEQIRQADCIVVVFSVDDNESFAKIREFWLPEIRRIRRDSNDDHSTQKPVILVGNKIDLRGNANSDFFETNVKPLMHDFKEIESCVECSAKKVMHIHEVFFFAQKAVLYPTGILIDPVDTQLHPACVIALKRIFKLCDKDKDDQLNDHELAEFQQRCFGVPLLPKEIEAVKQVIKSGVPDGVTPNGLTFSGFLYLHHIFIQKGKSETTWTVLRKYGYGDNLKLREEFLLPDQNVSDAQTVELSAEGYKFFTHLFKQFDKDQDGALSMTELENLFSTSPGCPWGKNFTDNAVTNDQGLLTLQGFLAQWSMTTLLDYKTTLRYLAYLGFEDDTRKALLVQKRKKSDIKKRNVFLVYVFGLQECGKTTFLNRFVGKEFEEASSPPGSKTVCNATYIDKAEKYIVIQEFDDQKEVIASNQKMEKCDLVCFLYDTHNPKSFAFAASLQQKISEAIDVPSVFFGTKTDLNPVKQTQSPEEFCKQQKFSPPKQISLKKNEDRADIYSSMIQEIYDYYQSSSSSRWAVMVGASLFAVIIAGGAFYFYKHNGPKHYK